MSEILTLRGLAVIPDDALWAPWSLEQVYQLRRRQEDERATTYRCPHDRVELWATIDGWMCARNGCDFRQSWVPAQHTRPFVPPPQAGT